MNRRAMQQRLERALMPLLTVEEIHQRFTSKYCDGYHAADQVIQELAEFLRDKVQPTHFQFMLYNGGSYGGFSVSSQFQQTYSRIRAVMHPALLAKLNIVDKDDEDYVDPLVYDIFDVARSDPLAVALFLVYGSKWCSYNSELPSLCLLSVPTEMARFVQIKEYDGLETPQLNCDQACATILRQFMRSSERDMKKLEDEYERIQRYQNYKSMVLIEQ